MLGLIKVKHCRRFAYYEYMNNQSNKFEYKCHIIFIDLAYDFIDQISLLYKLYFYGR